MTDAHGIVKDDQGRIWQGMLVCWSCNILHIILGLALVLAVTPVGIVVFGGIGLVQLTYVVPFYFRYKKQGKPNLIKGLIIAASITALLNAGCWGGVSTLKF